MFGNREIDSKEAWREGGAEGVAVHECNLSANGLVLEEVLLRRNHVCQNFFVRFHNGSHCLASNTGQ